MNVTILIVDDSRLTRTQIKSFMNALNICQCTHIEAENGEDALTVLQTRSVDLVFLDWNMPKMNGMEFLRKIRLMENLRELPVIMITSETDKENILETLSNGVMDYIIKPISKDIFDEKMVKYIKDLATKSDIVEFYITTLIVDDSRLTRAQIKGLMNEMNICNCTHVEAENGEEALKVLERQSVDIVFLDWNMPKMNGMDMLRKIRGIEKFRELPVIMVTSESDKELILSALANGVMDYIIKPIAKETFDQKVAKCVHGIVSSRSKHVLI